MSTSEEFSEALSSRPNSLWNVTWSRINKFLPSLKSEIFPTQASEGGSSYAALMMGVGKNIFSVVGGSESPAPPEAHVATATDTTETDQNTSVQDQEAVAPQHLPLQHDPTDLL